MRPRVVLTNTGCAPNRSGSGCGCRVDGDEESWMHIPDGYLSPATCAVVTATMVPVWAVAARRARRVVKSRYAPMMAVGAAYSFLVMMFNVPIPDGTTAHAVGAVLIAVLLGRWAAVVSVSTALLIQALFFGDGGVLAFGANAFNMAFVMPFVGYGVYRLVAGDAALTAPRRALAAGIGGYVGLNASALMTAIELGVQPTLFHTADGTPLYAPFHLAQTIPAMALAHLTVAGFVEAALTVGVVTYLQRANVPLLRLNHPDVPLTAAEVGRRPLSWRWAFYGLGGMVLLSPLGLLAPGGAFGEDAPAELDLAKYHLGAVPSGLNGYAGWWSHTLLDGYGFADGSNARLGYVLSALIGALAVGVAIALVIGALRLVGRVRGNGDAARAGVA
jgi:cobalt/nickel transport system permease protein